MEKRKKIARLSEKVAIFVFVAILMVSILAALCMGKNNIYQVFIAVLGCLVLVLIVSKCNINYKSGYAFFFLLIVCVLVKGSIVVFVQPVPAIDDLAMFGFANEIITYGKIAVSGRYIAGFPHIMGYVSFIAIFFKIFGYVPIVAAYVNVCLSIISMVIIYRIGDKIFDNKKMAFWASFLWCICPSQTLWNCFVLSETYYTTLLLVSIYIIMCSLKEKKCSVKKMGIYGVFIGIALGLFNMTRPVGIILIIALALIIFCIENLSINKQMLVLLLSSSICFLLMQGGTDLYVKYMVGEKPAGFPWYNIAVGCNTNYDGRWNQEDWDTFIGVLHGQESAVAAQEKMKPVVLEHIKSGDNWGKFLLTKIKNFVGDDSSTLRDYLGMGGVNYGKKQQIMLNICNIFFYLLELLGIGSAIAIIKSKKQKEIYLCVLFYIGSYLAYMMVEVQTRYHYPMTAITMILGGYLLGTFGKKENGINHFN